MNKYIRSKFFGLVLGCLAYFCGFSSAGDARDELWNALIFTQHWPITTCIDHLEKKPNGSCNLFPNMTSWGVHGLWPTLSGKMGPNFCNNSWTFKLSTLTDIEPYLIKYWPNIFGDQTTESLWKHEWQKHGTCAAEIEQFDSELKYFSKGIDYIANYDLVSILGSKQIYPSDEKPYGNDDIFSAIKYHLNKNPIIDCTYNHELKRKQLSQIKLCFNRFLQMIDCDKLKEFNHLEKTGNCPEKGVFYPSSVRTKDNTYHYPRQLAIDHTAKWFKASSCSSLVCGALKVVRALSLLTF